MLFYGVAGDLVVPESASKILKMAFLRKKKERSKERKSLSQKFIKLKESIFKKVNRIQMTNLEKKEEQKTEICVSEENKNLSSICEKRCRVCSSNFIEEIHLMKKEGKELAEICSSLKENHNFDISVASLSRHFKKFRERQQLKAAEILQGDLIEGATKQAAHTKEIVALIDVAIEQLKTRAKSGTLNFDVSDLEKMMKMRYQVLNGEMDDEVDVIKSLQAVKVIFNQNQARLFD